MKGFALTLLCHKVCQNRCFPTQRFKSSAAALSHGKPFHAFPSASTACYLRERPAVGPTGTATALTPVRRDRARTPCPASPEATPVAAVLCHAMLCYAMPCCAVPCQSHAGLGSAQRPPPITNLPQDTPRPQAAAGGRVREAQGIAQVAAKGRREPRNPSQHREFLNGRRPRRRKAVTA